jgi:hypothetical protein
MQAQSFVPVEVASVTGVLGAGEIVVAVDGTVAGVDFAADAVLPTTGRCDAGRAWTRTPSHSGPGVPGSIRRSKGVTALPALFAAATLVPDNDGRTVARDAISAAVLFAPVLP